MSKQLDALLQKVNAKRDCDDRVASLQFQLDQYSLMVEDAKKKLDAALKEQSMCAETIDAQFSLCQQEAVENAAAKASAPAGAVAAEVAMPKAE